MFFTKYAFAFTCMMWLAFTACQTEDVTERDYPVVMTLPVEHISRDGARLNAKIAEGPSESISEYGFVWGTSIVLNVRDSQKIAITGSPANGRYSCDIIQSLDNLQKYYIRSYIIAGERIIYGNMVSFVTLAGKL